MRLALHHGRAAATVGVLTADRGLTTARPPEYRGAVKPFVLLATRAEDLPADAEYALFLRYAGLEERDLIRVRLEAGPMPRLDLNALSGIFVGGGPFNASDPPELKSPVQHRVEAEFNALLDEVVARDFPFLGACYGVGPLGLHQGGWIDRMHAEPIGVVPVTLSEAVTARERPRGPESVRRRRRASTNATKTISQIAVPACRFRPVSQPMGTAVPFRCSILPAQMMCQLAGRQ